MDITSLTITFIGILIILGLYFISRASRAKLPQEKPTRLPDLKNPDGSKFTSVLDDIAATDGFVPNVTKKPAPQTEVDASSEVSGAAGTTAEATSQASRKKKPPVLFISPNDKKGLDGNLIAKALKKNGLVFGEFDVYHYPLANFTKDKSDNSSLFHIANGVEPWTLRKEDLYNKTLAGLSIVLLTPCKIDNADAVKNFVAVSHKLSQDINGLLKNDSQEIFTPKDEQTLLASFIG